MIDISYLTDRCHAILQNLASFARRQLNERVVTFFRDQLRRTARRAHHLRTLARTQFDIVHRCTRRNVTQGKRVPNQDVSIGTADHLGAYFQTRRLQNVPLLTIRISQQRDTRRPVRIVFNRNHGRRNPSLVALEVNDAQLALVPATTVPQRDIAAVTASARTLLRFQQRLVRLRRRDVLVAQSCAIAQRLGCRSVCLYRHNSALSRQASVVSRQVLSFLLTSPTAMPPEDDRRLTTTGSVRTRASSRPISILRTPSSNPDDSRRNCRAAALFPENSLCEPSPPSL